MYHVWLMFHMIGDFIVQNDEDVERRINKPIEGNMIHILKTFVSYIVLGLVFMGFTSDWYNNTPFTLMIGLGMLAAMHLVIDICKSYVKVLKNKQLIFKNTSDDKFNMIAFVIDQGLHLITIFWIVDLFPLNITYNAIYIIWINAIIIATFVGHELIRMILKCSCVEYVKDSKNFRAAKMIGILERLIMTPAIILGALEMLIIIIGLKVFTDFEQKESKIINRNSFIIGNLLSIIMAFLGVIYYYRFV